MRAELWMHKPLTFKTFCTARFDESLRTILARQLSGDVRMGDQAPVNSSNRPSNVLDITTFHLTHVCTSPVASPAVDGPWPGHRTILIDKDLAACARNCAHHVSWLVWASCNVLSAPPCAWIPHHFWPDFKPNSAGNAG